VHCIVTAGPTYEPLDQVRRLTNFSTGKLGSNLGNFLVEQGHRVTLLRGYYSIFRGELNAQKVITFETTADLRDKLHALSGPSVQAVFHAAAVSDFTFGKAFRRPGSSGQLTEVRSAKFSTGRGTLLVELVPTSKILRELRGWFPNAELVGWKYEVEGSSAQAITAGQKQIAECATDACVVNGSAYGQGFGLVTSEGECVHIRDVRRLYQVLEKRLRKKAHSGNED
jgi:phosphopantothenoylcysteine decarboxylase/phosphopantothenate--cysteine ligase